MHMIQCTCMKKAIHSTESCAINKYYIIQSKNLKETNNTYWKVLSLGLLIFFEI